MTDQEQKSNAPSAGGSDVVVMVEKKAASRHKPIRPTELPDEAPIELHHKRSRAPAVPSVVEEFKSLPVDADIREKKESEHVMSSEKLKQVTTKKPSKRAASPEGIAMMPIEVDVQKADIVPPATQPIPAPVGPALNIKDDTKDVNDNDADDSITEEIADLRTAESSHKEWSDEEAGGLPRSESRASRGSRVSRVWRQLFCCGVPYESPSEHNISSPRGGEFASGI